MTAEPRRRSRSPCLRQQGKPVIDAGHRLLADGLLPYGVCERVTRFIWSSARSQAEKAHAESKARAAGCPPSDPSKPEPAQRDAAQPSQSQSQSSCALTGGLSQSQPSQSQRESSFALTGVLSQSQPSQSQPEEALASSPGIAAAAEEILRLAWLTLAESLEEVTGCHSEGLGAALCRALRPGSEAASRSVSATKASSSPAEDVLLARVRAMSLCAVAYWRDVSQDLGKAASSLCRFLEQQRRLYWRRPAWRGVNLGGWLLLEPGPSHQLFERFGAEAGCEWDLMQKMQAELGTEGTAQAVQAHRASFVTEEDFRKIRAHGFNSVRIPFGYWIVTGPANGDAFVGPGLEFLDRALEWCQKHGLQALLDLHGAPGGESGEKPCGRERKEWEWQQWRLGESIEVLKIISQRYKGHAAVTGISVCNEPSEKVPSDVLCNFYDEAVRTIRAAGMPPDEVSIILPVYRTERLDEVWRLWNKHYDGFVRHTNVAFDLHLYHCFGAWWQRQGFGGQLRMTKRHRKILRRVPAVVGEWSLALPQRALAEEDVQEDDAYKAFASAQLDAYSQASHGWFFWNWCDSPLQHPGWDVRTCFSRGWISENQISARTSASSSKASC